MGSNASPEFTSAEFAKGETLFKGPCTFVKGVASVDGLPKDGRTEVAFAGRSNVGKSSLINALTGRTSLARVSVTPGRTRELNFFALGPPFGEDGKPKAGREGDKDGALYLVDMPGYGYARASKAEVKAWTRLIGDYLKGRRELKRVFLLIDARHGIKPNDKETMKLLDEAAVSYQVVLTKADKPKAAELETIQAKVASDLAKHPAAYPANSRKLGPHRRRDQGAARRHRRAHALTDLVHKARPQRRDPDDPGKGKGEEHAGRGEVLGDADRFVLLGLNVVAQPFDRCVQELDRENEEQAADERNPGPHVRRDEEGQREKEAGDRHLLLDRRFGREPFPKAAKAVPEGGADSRQPASSGKGRARGRETAGGGFHRPFLFRLLTHRIGSPTPIMR